MAIDKMINSIHVFHHKDYEELKDLLEGIKMKLFNGFSWKGSGPCKYYDNNAKRTISTYANPVTNVGNTTSLASMFYSKGGITQLDLSNLNVSEVTTTNMMFCECSDLEVVDVSNWDTSKIENMYYMFGECSELTSIIGIGNWDVSNVTNMNDMFIACSKLEYLDLSNWNLNGSVTTTGMFKWSNNLKQIFVRYCNTTTKNILKAALESSGYTVTEENGYFNLTK